MQSWSGLGRVQCNYGTRMARLASSTLISFSDDSRRVTWYVSWVNELLKNYLREFSTDGIIFLAIVAFKRNRCNGSWVAEYAPISVKGPELLASRKFSSAVEETRYTFFLLSLRSDCCYATLAKLSQHGFFFLRINIEKILNILGKDINIIGNK